MAEPDNNDVQIFIRVLKERSCYDFSNYSISSLKRRIEKVLIDNDLSITQLVDKILHDTVFTERIVRDITVGTTELFRDPEMWISLRQNILPYFSPEKGPRVWHAGCSSGQEVYSMMILLNELNMLEKSEIYASDINPDVLESAKQGVYKYRFNKVYLDNMNKVFDSDPDRTTKTETSSEGSIKCKTQKNVELYPGIHKTCTEQEQESRENHPGTMNSKNQVSFLPEKKYFTINTLTDEIRMLPFLTHKPVYKKSDLVKDENPFTGIFDIIVCRNVIIYFNFELQNRVFNLFYRNLTDKGCLVLGTHESIIGPYSSFFEKKYYAYFKIQKT